MPSAVTHVWVSNRALSGHSCLGRNRVLSDHSCLGSNLVFSAHSCLGSNRVFTVHSCLGSNPVVFAQSCLGSNRVVFAQSCRHHSIVRRHSWRIDVQSAMSRQSAIRSATICSGLCWCAFNSRTAFAADNLRRRNSASSFAVDDCQLVGF